jgi:hypothetical protein
MTKYRVLVEITEYKEIDIEADSPAAAGDKIMETYNTGNPLCCDIFRISEIQDDGTLVDTRNRGF